MEMIYNKILNTMKELTGIEVSENDIMIKNEYNLITRLDLPSFWNIGIDYNSILLDIVYDTEYLLYFSFKDRKTFNKYKTLLEMQNIGTIEERNPLIEEEIRVLVITKSMICLSIALNLLSLNLLQEDIKEEYIFC